MLCQVVFFNFYQNIDEANSALDKPFRVLTQTEAMISH